MLFVQSNIYPISAAHCGHVSAQSTPASGSPPPIPSKTQRRSLLVRKNPGISNPDVQVPNLRRSRSPKLDNKARIRTRGMTQNEGLHFLSKIVETVLMGLKLKQLLTNFFVFFKKICPWFPGRVSCSCLKDKGHRMLLTLSISYYLYGKLNSNPFTEAESYYTLRLEEF